MPKEDGKNSSKPLTPEDIELIGKPNHFDENGNLKPEIFSGVRYLSFFAQTLLNATNRHFWTVAKIFTDAGKSPIEQLKTNPHIFIQGFRYRAIQQLFVIGPCLEVRRRLKDNYPQIDNYTLSAATSAIDTPANAILETRAAKNVLAKMGKDISSNREFFNTAKLTILPLFVRGYLVWLANNSDETNLSQKALYGGIAGIVSAIPDSFSNAVMRTSSYDKTVIQNYLQAVKAMSLKNTIQAAPYRFPAGATASVLLSQKVGEEICKILDPLFQSVTRESWQSNPKTKISALKSEKLIDQKSQSSSRKA
ncbi:MAG: hypothetical protein SFV53_02115 [Rickettsiales bacterium]|nr:hypothetical protein [Rickettsiales bacterium]